MELPIIDLRSDTIAKPTPAMVQAMMHANVGDDVFDEDPTVNALQEQIAHMFGMEAALFCSSGTQTNQLAIMAHCRPGDEVICHEDSHIYVYEGGGIMANAHASVRLLAGQRGLVTASQVEEAIAEDNIHYPASRMVSLENSMNRGGGALYNWDEILKIKALCDARGLVLHLDGARLWNALVAKPQTALAYGNMFESISVCLSKGLGCPVGSVILGNRDFIKQCTRLRKRMGGGWRQAGYLAAAGLYALDHNLERLTDDHRRAKAIEQILVQLPQVAEVQEVETNILIFKLVEGISATAYKQQLLDMGIKAFTFGPDKIRFVTHLEITDQHINQLQQRLLG
jgi:threonine aldolase